MTLWVQTASGTPVTYAYNDASTVGVVNPWATTSKTGTAAQPLAGVGNVLGQPVWSPSGSWRAVLESSVAVWRSQDGLAWERVPTPDGLGSAVAISDTGVLTLARAVYSGSWIYTQSLRFVGGDWYGPVAVAAEQYYGSYTPVAVVSDGSKLVVVAWSGYVFSSSNGGLSWSAPQYPGTSSVSSVEVIGGQLHLVGSNGYRRWSFATETFTGTGPTAMTATGVFSQPGSTTGLWAVAATANGVSVWSSTDAGVTWSTPTTSLAPYRPGVVWNFPRVLADGKVHLYGSLTEAGVIVVYETSFDPATSLWSTPRKTTTALASGSLVVLGSQRQTGVQTAVTLWVQTASGTPVTYAYNDASTVGVVNPWATTSKTGTAAQPLAGVGNVLGQPVWSPSGSWRAVLESSVAVWRSQDGLAWERVPTPDGLGSAVAISDTGVLTLARAVYSGSWIYTQSLRFVGGDWYGPVAVAAEQYYGSYTPVAVVSDGSKLVVVAWSGYVFSSSNGGLSWSAPQYPGTSSVSSVEVIGGQLHLVGSNGYRRWSFASETFTGTGPTAMTATGVFSQPGSTTALWAAAATGNGVSVWSSTDAGVTWGTVQTSVGPYRPGVSWLSPRVLADGKVHLYGSAVEAGVIVVYETSFDPATGLWGAVTKVSTTKTSGTLTVWPTQRTTGTQNPTTLWVQTSSGTPITYNYANASTGFAASAWPTTTQTGTAAQPLTGVANALGQPVWSPSGTWRAVLESTVAVWRSQDGLAWERVPTPEGIGSAIAVSNTGTITLARSKYEGYYSYTQSLQFAGGEWAPPVNIATACPYYYCTYYDSSSPVGVVSDGSKLVVVTQSGHLFSSSNGGSSWSAPADASLSPVSSVELIGSYAHLLGSGGYRRWSFATETFTGTVANASVTATNVFAQPGSSAALWATAATSTGVSVWSSTDAGVSWGPVQTSLAPYRPGIAWTIARVLTDGKVHRYGSTVEAGVVVVYETSFDPTTSLWGAVTKVVTTKAAGTLTVWPTQRISGAQNPITVWVQSAVGTPTTYTYTNASSGFVIGPWPTTTQTGTTAQPLSGVANTLGQMVYSPSGSWRAVLEGSVAVWRSQDGLAWERVPTPDGLGSAVAVSDTGVLTLARLAPAGLQSSQFTGGEWSQPATLIGSSSNVGAPAAVVSDGSKLAVVTASGYLFSSSNGGAVWSTVVDSGVASVSSVEVIGGQVHIVGSGGYRRWSFATEAFTGTAATASVTATNVFSQPGSTTSLWATAATLNGLSVWSSTDAGVSWSAAQTSLAPYRSGVSSWSSPRALADGKIRLYGTTVESAGVVVYEAAFDPATGVWSTPRRTTTSLASGTLMVLGTQRQTGIQTAATLWVRTRGGTPPTYTFTDASTGSVVDSTVSQPLASVASALGPVVWSPSSSWRAVLEGSAAVWRSQDGLVWARVPTPEGLGSAVAISDAGVLTLARFKYDSVNSSSQSLQFENGVWSAPVTIATLASYNAAYAPMAVVSDGSKLAVVTASGYLFSSSNGGVLWSAPAHSGLYSVSSVEVVGGQLHVVSGTYGYRRWSFATETFTGTAATSSVTATNVFSQPGSTTSLWATSANGSGVSVWSSTDAGVSWSVVQTSFAPYRYGVMWGSPRVLGDGKVHLYGTNVESGTVVVHETSFDPVTSSWSTLRRTTTSLTSGSLVVLATQRQNGTQIPATLWIETSAGTPLTYTYNDASAGSVADPFVTNVQTGTAAQPVSGLSSGSTTIVSPSGTWRAIVDGSTVWRSSDGLTWEGVPTSAVSASAVSIGDDGSLIAITAQTFGTVNINSRFTAQVFRSGEWGAPTTIGSGGSWNDTDLHVASSGSIVMMVSQRGMVYYSEDGGRVWTSGGGVGADTTSIEVAHNTAHIFGLTRYFGWFDGPDYYNYSRWSFTSKGALAVAPADASEVIDPTMRGRVTKVYANPLVPGETVKISVGPGTGLVIRKSSNNGDTWTEVLQGEPIPMRDGVTFGDPRLLINGDVVLSGAFAAADGVHVDQVRWSMATQLWSTATDTPMNQSAGSLLAWPSQSASGATATTPELWLMNGTATRVPATGTSTTPWAPVTSVSRSAELVCGLPASGSVDRFVSPNRAWTLVRTDNVLWRSSNGKTWERVPVPAVLGAKPPLGIRDDGSIVSAASQYYEFPWPSRTALFSYFYEGGEWKGPIRVGVSTGSIAAGLFASNGPTLVLITTGGGVYYSDTGRGWAYGGAVGGASTVDVVGQIAYILGDGGTYSRWSFAAHAPLLFSIGGTDYVTLSDPSYAGSRVVHGSGIDSNIWMVKGGIQLTQIPSTTAGYQFDQGFAELYPRGVTSTVVAPAQDGKLYSYATATCTAATQVYRVSHQIGSQPGFSDITPIYLDESKTATLLNAGVGGTAPAAGPDAWFTINSAGTRSLVNASGSLPSPEAVFGHDGYGLQRAGVNAAIGGFVENAVDAQVAGVGPALAVNRTYNSQDRRVGMFGQGWTSNYETRVFENCVTKDVTVLLGDGRREFYGWDGTKYVNGPGYTSTLAKSGTTGWTLSDTDGTVRTFRADGRMTSIADADNQRVDLTWDASNQMTVATDSVSGRSLTFSYTNGRVTSVSTLPVTIAGSTTSLTWNYDYTGSALTRVCEPRNNDLVTGNCTTYTIADGAITEVIDANGHFDNKIGYDGGTVAWQEDGAGNRTTFTYVTPQKTVVTDARGNTLTSEFDDKFRLVKETDATGAVTTHEYDAAGFRFKTTDPNGNATTRTFDARGNVSSETNALGQTSWFEYDANNNRVKARDGRSANATDNTYVITSTYDGTGRHMLSTTTPPTAQQPLGTAKSWAYTAGTEAAIGGGTAPAGLLKSETDERGTLTTYRYDSKGNLRESTDRAGLVTAYAFDELGRVTSSTSYASGYPSGLTTTFALDQLGNIVKAVDPASTNSVTGKVHRRQVVVTYDAASNVSAQTESDTGGSTSPDPSRTTSYTYDAADRLLSVTDPEGGVSAQEFDLAGNVSASVDARGTRTEYTYEARNLPTKAIVKAAATSEGAPGAHDVTLGVATYDAGGRRDSMTDARGAKTAIGYNAANQMTGKTLVGYHNLDGSTRDMPIESHTYDAAGHVTSTTNGGTRTEQFTYDAANRLVATVLDPGGLNRTMSYTYDATGNVTSRALSDGARTEETRSAFDTANRMTSTTVENGAADPTTTYSYDNRGVMLSTTDARGNAAGGTPSAYRVDYTIDELGRPAAVQSPAVTATENGSSTTGVRPTVTYGYDTFGGKTHTRDERNNITTQTFDRLGRNTAIVHPAYTQPGGATLTPTELFVYDPIGNLKERTDRRGQTTAWTFDRLNRATTQTDPAVGGAAPGVSYVFYDDAGDVLAQVDPRGARTELAYDDARRQRTSTDVVRNATATPDRFTTTFDYDDLGNVTYQQSAADDVTRWEYSKASEPTKQTDPTGAVTTTAFDLAGRQIMQLDALNRKATVDFDLAGRPTTERRYDRTGTLLTTATTAYDLVGNVTASISPRGYTTTYAYDPLSRMTTVNQPVSASSSITSSYAYDAAGNQTALTDGRGNTTVYTYTPWNLPESTIEPATATTPAPADRTFTAVYDAAGLPLKSLKPGGTEVQRTFDNLGRLTAEAGGGPNTTTASHSFGYDVVGNQTSATDGTTTIGFNYDDRGLLTATTGAPQAQSSFAYDQVGRMTQRTDAAGTTAFTWTARNQLGSLTDPLTGTTRTNTFDATAQLAAVAYGQGGSRSLTYDDLGQLTGDSLKNSANAATAGYGYGYDADGNLTTLDVNLPGNPAAGHHTYTYDRADRLASWTKPDTTTATYDYDASANLTNNAGVTAVFDQRNQMTSSGPTAYSWTPRGTLASTTTAGVVTTATFDALDRQTANAGVNYTYDPLGRVLAAGAQQFSYAGFEIDAVRIDQTLLARSPSGAPIAAKTGTDPAVLFGRNRHGDIGYQHDAAGNVSATRVYDPLGAVTGQTGALTALGYQGDYTDPTSGDVWMGARWYRPGTGSFTSRDTVFGHLSTPVSLNRYTYANGNPLGMWDPDGRESKDVGRDVHQDSQSWYQAVPTRQPSMFGTSSAMDIGVTICTGREGCSDGSMAGFNAVNDAYQARMANPGAAIYDATLHAMTAPVSIAASMVCGSVAGLVTENPVAIGAAAQVCGGAAARAWTSFANGGDWGDMSHAALDGRAIAKDAIIGGAVGFAASIPGRFVEAFAGAGAEVATAEAVVAEAEATVSSIETEVFTQGRLFETGPTWTRAAAEDVALAEAAAETPGQLQIFNPETGVPAYVGDGPVGFRAPASATADEIAQVKAYCEGCDAALDAGELSPIGRVSTKGALRADSSRGAAAERVRAANAGTPYAGHAGHTPDTTWTGNPDPFLWMDLSPRVNQSLGGQARGYPIGYKPTGFVFIDDTLSS